MTNQEINEYLAEHLFKLERGVGFGLWENDCPNYIENWQRVVAKMIKDFLLEINICPNGLKEFEVEFIDWDLKFDEQQESQSCKTIGEAVCRAAVEYLKQSENEK